MYYDVAIIEKPAYKGIMWLPLTIIYFVTSYWQVTRCRCTLLWCDTNGSCRLQKDLVKAVTVSVTACHISRLTIRPGLAGTVPEFKVLSRSAERKSRFVMESGNYASLLKQKFSY